MRIAAGFNADLPVPNIIEYAKEADDLGFDSFWMHEHSFGREAVSYLGAAAEQTTKAKIGVACLSPYVRHPVLLAMTMATLQESSEGRAILGLGTGFPTRLDLMGIRHDKPIAALKETIEICRGVWSGSALTYSGKVFTVKNVKALTGKVDAKIPIYIAGWKNQMLALAGKYADGYVAKGGESTQSISQIIRKINSNAERAGRSPQDIDAAAYLLT
ncbi:MAG: LLM class flavin-dependent oxidoreductase, partial [Rhabdochlamydiaceae bacterium]